MEDASHLSLVGAGAPDEDQFEKTTIERLEALDYEHRNGRALRREHPEVFSKEKVVFRPALRSHLATQHPHLPERALTSAVQCFAAPDGVTLALRNKNFHALLTEGFDLPYEHADGSEDHQHIHPVDWSTPQNNTFWVVDQLPIKGDTGRRPDLIIYVNGLPLVVFELKNPYDEHPTVKGAHNQLQHYQADIARLFDFNAFCVISDGTETLHGIHSASMEWFNPWKSIDGREVEGKGTGSMKTLVEGLFPKERLLEYVRYFIVHEKAGEEITKKGALYHQFFGVREAVQQAERATRPEGDRKIGVIWHTQGSGKSLSMVFFVAILRERLGNPAVLVQVDRTDLDEQLYDSFVAARSLVGSVSQADSVKDLRRSLRTSGGNVVFSTIEKFRLTPEELEHPVLSDRRDLIVIADEAHRTQYGFEPEIREGEDGPRLAHGYAHYLRQALPNASFIGFTGTPIEEKDRDTTAVFGNVIHTYDLTQAQVDESIVPIHYEARHIGLRLDAEDLDDELEALTGSADAKARWGTLEAAVTAQLRIERLAEDIVAHFEKRTEALFGKGMIVCISRAACVRLYDEITKLRPGWRHPALDKGQIKVVMSGNIADDPREWNEAGHLTTKSQRDAIKDRMKDPDDSLKLAIVCDMWLTGTNLPCLHTLYVDKPLRGHNLMQAIARVNRVFEDKPAGLIVDYIGIGTELKEATQRYTEKDFGTPAEDLEEQALPQFHAARQAIRGTLPKGIEVTGWRRLSRIAFEDLCTTLYAHYLETDEKRDHFLLLEKRLSSAFSLVKHLDAAQEHVGEVAFYQLLRKQLRKTIKRETREEQEAHAGAVQDLIDQRIDAEGAVDIFEAAGLDKPDLSILDEAFLEEFTSKEHQNLRVRLLEKLLHDEIKLRRQTNLQKHRSLQEMLERTLTRYRNNAITAAEVIQAMVEIRREMMEEDRRKEELDLTDDELAFLDAIEGLSEGDIYDKPFLCDLVHEIVQAVQNNLGVDWTKPHREAVKASVVSAVKMVMRRRGVKKEHFQFILNRVMEQAEALYEDWPARDVA